MKKITPFLTIVILFLSLLVRFYKLGVIPNGFFFDEATISYQAYSLVKTGRDTWGTFLPLLSFKDYGEYILPLGIYFQSFWVAVLGLSVWAARLPHVFLGVVTTLGVVWVGKNLAGLRTGIIAGFLFALSPLALGWNRFVYEGNLGTLFFLLAVGSYLICLRDKKYFLISSLLFGLSMLTYHIFLVTTPLYVLLSLVFIRPKLPKRTLVLGFAIALFFGFWALGSIYTGSGRSRLTQASNLLPAQQLDVLNHQIGYCGRSLPNLICRFWNNKYLLLATNYLNNYTEHFSPQFLGFDATFLRRNILPQTGLVYPIELISLILGLWVVSKKLNDPGNKLLLLWLAVYPISNSFTGTGEISRIAFAAPLFSLLSARGINFLLNQRKVLAGAFLLILLFQIFSFLQSYFVIFPITNAYYTNFGYDQVFSWVRENRNKYDHIYITQSYAGSLPYLSAMFFLPVNPKDFQKPGLIDRHQTQNNYFAIDQIGNLYFVTSWQTVVVGPKDFLIVTPEEVPNIPHQELWRVSDPVGRKLLVGLEPTQKL